MTTQVNSQVTTSFMANMVHALVQFSLVRFLIGGIWVKLEDIGWTEAVISTVQENGDLKIVVEHPTEGRKTLQWKAGQENEILDFDQPW